MFHKYFSCFSHIMRNVRADELLLLNVKRLINRFSSRVRSKWPEVLAVACNGYGYLYPSTYLYPSKIVELKLIKLRLNKSYISEIFQKVSYNMHNIFMKIFNKWSNNFTQNKLYM